jgi:hypothetical protein
MLGSSLRFRFAKRFAMEIPQTIVGSRPRQPFLLLARLASRLFGRFGIALASLAVSLLVAEAYLRILRPELQDNRKFQSAYLGRVFNSYPLPVTSLKGLHNYVGLSARGTDFVGEIANRDGFRGGNLTPVRRPGEYRVALVGDSMFRGVGVPLADTIAGQMESAATRWHLGNLRVINLGVCGIDTVQMLLLARHYLPQVRPDRVVLGFFVANDIFPNCWSFVEADGSLGQSPQVVSKLMAEVVARSPLIHWSLGRELLLKFYYPRLRYQMSREPGILASSFKWLEQFQQMCKEHGYKLTVLVISTKQRIQGSASETWAQSEEVSRIVVEGCKQRGMEVIDSVDLFTGVADRRPCFFPGDGHFAAAGNRVVAEGLVSHLSAEVHASFARGSARPSSGPQ